MNSESVLAGIRVHRSLEAWVEHTNACPACEKKQAGACKIGKKLHLNWSRHLDEAEEIEGGA